MRKIAALAVTLLFIAGLSPEVKAQQPSNEKVVTIEAGMTCSGCKKTIETGLAKEVGVKSVKADLKTKTVTVSYDASQTSDEKLVKSIEQMGYSAKISDPNANKTDETAKKKGSGC